MNLQTRPPAESLPQFWKTDGVVPFFREVLRELKDQNIADYRLKITPTENSFEVRVSHNKSHKHGPRTFDYRVIPIVHTSVRTITLVANHLLLLFLLLHQRRVFQKRYELWLPRTVNGVWMHCWVILIQPTYSLYVSGSMLKLDLWWSSCQHDMSEVS